MKNKKVIAALCAFAMAASSAVGLTSAVTGANLFGNAVLMAFAEEEKTALFTFSDYTGTCILNDLDSTIAEKVGKVIKVEAIVESEGSKHSQILWGYYDENQTLHYSSGDFDKTAGVHRCVVEGEAFSECRIVQIQHVGKGSLLWVKVYFNDDTSVQLGNKTEVTGVSLDKTEAQTVSIGGTVEFNASITPTTATDQTVKWSVSGTNADAVKLYSDADCTEEVGTAATNTLKVYAKGISVGTATVTATSDSDSSKSASCDVTVNVPVAEVTLPDKFVTMYTGYVRALTATVSPDDATNRKVKWNVTNGSGTVALYSDASCTEPLTLNAETEALTVYAKPIAAGDDKGVTISVESAADSAKKASCAVTVRAIEPSTPQFTVTIPAEVTLGNTAEVSVSDLKYIPSGQNLVVTMSGSGTDGAFTVTNSGETLGFTVKKGETDIAAGGEIISTTENTSAELTFNTPTTAPPYAGRYTGTVTFNVSVAGNTVDLSKQTGTVTLKNGDIITGTVPDKVKLQVEDGAAITLKDVTVGGTTAPSPERAGIAFLGDGTLILEGENTVKSYSKYSSAITIAEGKTLVIEGTGKLLAENSCPSDQNYAGSPGIGSVTNKSGGNLVINSGDITAIGGPEAPGIGADRGESSFGNITINGGSVTAVGGIDAAGIGTSLSNSTCGDITINGGTVIATGGESSAGIGTGHGLSGTNYCGNITITGGNVTATSGEKNSACGIGTGALTTGTSTCGDILISGGTVNAETKDKFAAAIGSGCNKSVCGNVTITDGAKVKATKPETYLNVIGQTNGECGTVTIGGVVYTHDYGGLVGTINGVQGSGTEYTFPERT